MENITINNTNTNNESILINALNNIKDYIEHCITERQLYISIGGYGISIGRQSNGSYGMSVFAGDKEWLLTFATIKELWVKLSTFIKTAWNNGKK